MLILVVVHHFLLFRCHSWSSLIGVHRLFGEVRRCPLRLRLGIRRPGFRPGLRYLRLELLAIVGSQRVLVEHLVLVRLS